MKIIASSPSIVRAIETAQLLAQTPGPILLIGKCGTGKDLLAKIIHSVQKRRDFKAVDCSQISEMLIRQLLGYFDEARAAISIDPEIDAYEPGIIELASEGTVYLDRVDMAHWNIIRQIVDILKGKPYIPLGQTEPLKQGNIQFIASCEPYPFADQPDGYLHSLLRAVFGKRIITLPSLKERKEDLPELFKLFLDEFIDNKSIEIRDDFYKPLIEYEWPRNLWDLRRLAGDIGRSLSDEKLILTSGIATERLSALMSRSADPLEYSRKMRCGILAHELIYQDTHVDGDKLYTWIQQFSQYRGTYESDPRDIAEALIRILRSRFFYDNKKLRKILTALYERLKEEVRNNSDWDWFWKTNTEEALKRHIVVSNPLGLMKSPEAISPILRSVTGLSPGKNAVEFSNLHTRVRDEDKGLIIIIADDFIGSGKQLKEQIFDAILSNEELCRAIENKETMPINIFILACVAFRDGLQRAWEEMQKAPPWLKMTILAGDILGDESKAFHSESIIFPDDTVRKQAREIIIQRIGRFLYSKAPEGWGNLQSLVVFSHNAPNNTLPVLWKDGYVMGHSWKAIFPRMGAG